MGLKEVAVEELQFNPFTMIGNEWMLVAAGDEKGHNAMTAAWGGVGVLWKKNVVTAYIRPQRYTREFVDNNERFTLSFFGDEYREMFQIMGTKSGRDTDKEKEAGLTPFYIDGTTAYEEAKLVFVCKKQYHQLMLPDCFDVPENDEKWYPKKDYHLMYVGEIEKVLVRE